MKMRGISTLVIASLVSVGAHAELSHRWSFTTDTSDSVGSADLSIVGDSTVTAGAYDSIGGGAGSTYLEATGDSLGALDSTITGASAISFEFWINQDSDNGWTKMLIAGSGQNNFLAVTPRPGDYGDVSYLQIETQADGQAQIGSGVVLANNTDYYIAGILDDANNLLTIYTGEVGGTLSIATNAMMQELSSLSINSFFIGGNATDPTPFWGDGSWDGQIDEVRIWNHALSVENIQNTFAAGPDSVPDLFAPSDLQGTVVGTGTVNLSWTAESGATGYKVYRSTTSGSYGTAIATVSGSTFSDTTSTLNTRYYYVVTAVAGVNESLSGLEISVINYDTTDTTPPTQPTGLNGFYDGAAQLSWDAASEPDFSGYNLYRSMDSENLGSPIATGLTEPSYSDSDLAAGLTNYYAITAVDFAGNESGGDVLAFFAVIGNPYMGTLAHRWSFTTDASDSVGNADLTLAGNAPGTIANGVYDSATSYGTGENQRYLAAEGAALAAVASTLTNSTAGVTFEFWINQSVDQTWAKLLMTGTVQTNALVISPRAGRDGTPLLFQYDVLDENTEIGEGEGGISLGNGTNYYIAVTLDNANKQATLYFGAVGETLSSLTSPINNKLSVFPVEQFNIGGNIYADGGLFWPDSAFNGTIDEVRVWSSVMDQYQIEYNFNAGPETIDKAGYWLATYGQNDWTADPDGDFMPNLYEYGVGGHPLLSDSAAVAPEGWYKIDPEPHMMYVYRRLSDQSVGLNYDVVAADNLTLPSWSSAGALELGTQDIDGLYESVTNTIPVTETMEFFSLEIENP